MYVSKTDPISIVSVHPFSEDLINPASTGKDLIDYIVPSVSAQSNCV